ncbi:MAG TPA: hypothetical protein V6D47_18305 [Oscillatoriaceae cyanobacterium]
MKSLSAAVAAVCLTVSLAAPAVADTVYFKDGSAVRGQVKFQASTLTVMGPNNQLTFPLDSVRAISFTDEPIVMTQQNSEWLSWAALGVNLLAIAAAAYVVTRPH